MATRRQRLPGPLAVRAVSSSIFRGFWDPAFPDVKWPFSPVASLDNFGYAPPVVAFSRSSPDAGHESCMKVRRRSPCTSMGNPGNGALRRLL